MSTPNKDEVEGTFDKAAGSVKEAFGKVTGDEKTEDEGTAQRTGGEIQNTYGEAKRGIGDAMKDLGDKINR